MDDVASMIERLGAVNSFWKCLKGADCRSVFINKYISYLKWVVESPAEVRPDASSV